MRLLSIALIASFLQFGCERAPHVPEAFIGHFVSDKEATIERWRSEQIWDDKTENVIETIGPVLGTMEVISDGTSFTSFSGDWEKKDLVGFKPIDDQTAEIKSFSEEFQMETNARLEADADGYWLYSDSLVIGYCERFSRKSHGEQDGAGQPEKRSESIDSPD